MAEPCTCWLCEAATSEERAAPRRPPPPLPSPSSTHHTTLYHLYDKWQASQPDGVALCGANFVVEWEPVPGGGKLVKKTLPIRTYASFEKLDKKEVALEMCPRCCSTLTTKYAHDIW